MPVRYRSGRVGGIGGLLAEINRQLAAQGQCLRRGTILDASVLKTMRRPPRGDGIAPGDPHPGEPGADWTRKDGKPVFGYRFHIGIDEGSGLIRTLAFTSARVQDVERADALVTGDEAVVHADRAYEGQARRHRYMPVLPPWQARRSNLIARRHAPVEAVLQRDEASLWQGPRPMPLPTRQHHRLSRFCHHLQSQARRHPHR